MGIVGRFPKKGEKFPIHDVARLVGREMAEGVPTNDQTPTIKEVMQWVNRDVVNVKAYGAVGDNSSNNTTAFSDAMTAARETGRRKIYIPEGTYVLSTSGGTIFQPTSSAATDYPFEIFGDGMGKTIIKLADSTALTSSFHFVQLNGSYQSVHDMTFDGNNNTATGAYNNVFSASIYISGSNTIAPVHCEFKRLEVKNFNGKATGAGGSGIGLYTPWSSLDVNTTLSTAITSTGSQAVTPASMNNIYIGRRIFINVEEVLVTATTETTFTATLVGTHAAGVAITGQSQGRGYHTIEDCYVHDCYQATAFLTNSSANDFTRCVAKHGGASSLQHAFYIQGGYNNFDKCWAEGWAGYHYHSYKQVPNIDASGDMFTNCTSVNPVWNHAVIIGTTNADNPNFAVGESLTRYTTFQGCVFTQTNGFVSRYGIVSNHPTIVDGCTFEDCYTSTGSGAVDTSVDTLGSTITNNYFRYTNTPASSTNTIVIKAGAKCTISGNTIYLPDVSANATAVSGGIAITGNNIILAGANEGISISVNKALVEGNRIVSSGTGAVIAGLTTNMVVRGNYFETTYLAQINLASITGIIEGNRFVGAFRYDAGISSSLIFRNNYFTFSNGGYAGVTWDERSGTMLPMAVDSGTINEGRLVKLSGTGVVELLTSDTSFFGVSPSRATTACLVGYESDAVVTIYCDGAWTLGNYAIISSSAAGKVSDGGATPDLRVTVGKFINTGGGAGLATVRLL